MLRNKANFGVIEGLLTVLLGEKITIEQMQESESNQNSRDDTSDKLQVSSKEKDVISMYTPEAIFPEYYIIRVNEFNQVAKTPLEEWIAYLKNGEIRKDTTTSGLSEARKNCNT